MHAVVSGGRRWRPIRRVLLAATILSPVAMTSAQAADATVSTSTATAINLNQLLPNGGTVDILAGVNVSPGFFSGPQQGIAYTVTNGGTIANALGGAPGFLGSGGTINNLNGGTFTNSGGADGRSITMFGGGAGNMALINSGTLRGEVRLTQVIDTPMNPSTGNAGVITLTNQITGVIEGDIEISGGTSNTVTNAGRITGTILLAQDTNNPGAPSASDTVVIASTKTFTNASTGVINGGVLLGGGFVRNFTFNGQAVAYDVFTQGTLTNAGTISGPVAADTITNTGTINAAAGIANIAVISYGNASQTTYASLSGTLNNSGTITGDISVRTIVNSGTINGNLLYGTDTGFDIGTDEGAVIGGVQSLRGAAVSTSLTNSGNINGRITMANGSVTNTGTLALGSAIATSSVGGNFTQSSAGTLVIKVNDAGQGDKLAVTGQASIAGTLSVAAADGAWNINRSYSILTATGGVSGTFANLNINLEYLTPVLAYSANEVTLNVLRRTADIQEDVITETTEQQVSTSARRVATAVDARVDQAISAAFIALPTGERNALLPGSISGLAAGDAGGALWGTWATFTPTFLRQSLVLPGSATAQKVTGTSLSFLTGVDRTVGSRAVVGAFFSYESSDFDISGTPGDREGKGPLVGAYAGLVVTDWAYASIQINQAWLNNSIAEGTFGSAPVTGKFDSRRFMASSTFTAYKSWEKVKLSGKAGYSYSRETFDGYTASDGAAVTPPLTRLGRFSVGTELAGTTKTWLPYASATYEWDVDTTGVGDKNGAVLGAGMRYISGMFSFDLYGNGQVGRAGERAYSVGVNARYAF